MIRETGVRSAGGVFARALATSSVASVLLLAFVSTSFGGGGVRGAFGPTGDLARPSGGSSASEDLLAIYEPTGTRLLPTRKIGPRVYCSADCSVRATVKLDLPGRKDPKAAIFVADLIANHVYTATISPTAAERSRLIKGLSSSRLVVELTATDQTQRTDTDRRVFRFREAG